MYEEMVASKAGDTKRVIKQLSLDNSESGIIKSSVPKQLQRQSYELNPMDSESSGGTASPNMFNSASDCRGGVPGST